MDMAPTDPRHQNLCAYIEFLAADTPSPRTVQNNISHIRTYLRKAEAPMDQAHHCRVKWALTALNRDNDFVPRTKSAFPIATLQNMLRLLPQTEVGNILKVAILMMYHAALHQSEVLPYSSTSFDHKKHLSRADVVLNHNSLDVKIKFAKNMQSVYQTKSVTLHRSPDTLLCVVAAVHEMLQRTPTTSARDTFIVFSNSRRPVTTEFVRRNWQRHLTSQGIDTTDLSLHSIRKAAATAAHMEGCDELQTQQYGGWKSNAHCAYIAAPQKSVNSAIIRALNKSASIDSTRYHSLSQQNF